MQKKKQINHYSVAPLFHKVALQFVSKWVQKRKFDQGQRIHLTWIQSIEYMAACCPTWPHHMADKDFGDAFRQFPDLAAALLNELREQWAKLEKTKPGRLKKYMAFHSTVPWRDDFNSREANEEAERLSKQCQAEAQKLPSASTGRPVTPADEAYWEFCKRTWAQRKYTGPVRSTIGDVPVWNLQDGQIALAFETSPDGFPITKAQIREARRAVVADHKTSDAFAKKVLDKDGWLHIPAAHTRQRKFSLSK